MSKYTWIILAAIVAVGGYTYYSNQQAEEAARIEAEAVAAKAASDAKAAEEAAAAEAKAAEAAAAAKAAEEEAAKAAAEAKAAEAAAAAKAAEEEAAKAAAEEAKVAEEAAAKAAKEAEAAAVKAAEEAEAARVAAEEAAAKAAEEVESAAANSAEEEAVPATEGNSGAMATAGFGSDQDTGYAEKIWSAMLDQKLAGEDMVRSEPYKGTEPHGMMLELFVSEAVIQGHKGDLIVKRNFGPAGVWAEQVLENPEKHLVAVTVMFRREAGYDEDTQNWFWAKFKPDGTVEVNPKGMALAGRVAKGMDTGCIACHSSADGDDFVFSEGALD